MSRSDLETELEQVDYVRWTLCCRAMHIRIARGEFEGAHAMLRDFCKQPRRVLASADSPVAAVFETRIANAFERGGYFDIQSLRLEDDETLLQCGNFGHTGLAYVRNRIEEVMHGGVVESYGEDEDLIDQDLIGKPQSRPVIEVTSESKMPSNQEQVIAAIDLLVKSPDTVRDAIAQSIKVHEDAIEQHRTEIARLRKIESSVGLTPKKETGWGRRRDWTQVVEQIRAYVKANGPTKPGVVAQHTGLTRAQVGMAIRHTDVVEKVDGKIRLKA